MPKNLTPGFNVEVSPDNKLAQGKMKQIVESRTRDREALQATKPLGPLT